MCLGSNYLLVSYSSFPFPHGEWAPAYSRFDFVLLEPYLDLPFVDHENVFVAHLIADLLIEALRRGPSVGCEVDQVHSHLL
jgi:hypothetical protein